MNVRIVLCCELRNGIILTPFITDGTLYLQLKKAIKEPLKHFSFLFGEFLAIWYKNLKNENPYKNATTILREANFSLCAGKPFTIDYTVIHLAVRALKIQIQECRLCNT